MNPMQMAQEFFMPKKEKKLEEKPAPEPIQLLSIQDPEIKKILDDFFKSRYWPYLRDLIFQEIIAYQMQVDKNLRGALADPRDPNGKMAAYHGGRIKAGDEIKLVLQRLKKNYSQ